MGRAILLPPLCACLSCKRTAFTFFSSIYFIFPALLLLTSLWNDLTALIFHAVQAYLYNTPLCTTVSIAGDVASITISKVTVPWENYYNIYHKIPKKFRIHHTFLKPTIAHILFIIKYNFFYSKISPTCFGSLFLNHHQGPVLWITQNHKSTNNVTCQKFKS
jgi:hypothetical protein